MPAESHYKKALLLCGLALMAYILKFGFNAFIAHHLTKAAYGDFSVGMQTFMLASTLVLLGTNTAAKRFLSIFLKNRVDSDVKNYISWNIRLIWISSFLFVLLLLVFLGILVLIHLFDIQRIENYHIAIYMLFFSPLGAAGVLIASYLQCNSNIYWSNFLQGAGRFVFLIPLVYVAVYFFNATLTTATLVFLIVATFGCLLIAEIVIIFLKAPILAKKIFAPSAPSHIDLAWKRTSLRLISNQVIYSILMALDLYIVEIFGRNEHSVGEYAALLIITGFSATISAAICFFLAPLVAPNVEANKPYLQHAVNNAALINSGVNLVAIIGIGVLLKFVLSLFGPTYYNDTTIMVYIILSVGFYIRCLSVPAVQLLMYGGHEIFVMKINIFEMVTMLTVGVLLTKYFGIVGTAFTVSSVVSIRAIAFILYTHKKLSYKTIGIF